MNIIKNFKVHNFLKVCMLFKGALGNYILQSDNVEMVES